MIRVVVIVEGVFDVCLVVRVSGFKVIFKVLGYLGFSLVVRDCFGFFSVRFLCFIFR